MVVWIYGWPAIISEKFLMRITVRRANATAAKICSILEERVTLKKERHPRPKIGNTTMVVYQVLQPHAHVVIDIHTTEPTTQSHSMIADDALRCDFRSSESSCEMEAFIF